ncbi:MAG: sigma-70 family RNA polymerase sigma factor [Armatimonas sp.]
MGRKDRTIRWPWQRTIAATRPVDLAALQEAYTDLVYGYAFLRLRSHAEAEDITVEVFTALHQSPEKAAELPRAYLLGIARRKVTDRLRLRTRRKETVLEDTHPVPDASADGLLAQEAAAKLREVIDGLRPDYREALAAEVCGRAEPERDRRRVGQEPGAGRQRVAAGTRGSPQARPSVF